MDNLNSENLDRLHDAIYVSTNIGLPHESLVIAFNFLPPRIKSIGEKWGYNDIVFGDEVYGFFEIPENKKIIENLLSPQLIPENDFIMKIDHLAIWCNSLEAMRYFYMKYFSMDSNEKYNNLHKGFSSYFLNFVGRDKARIELMEMPNIFENEAIRGQLMGNAHIAISVGSKESVDSLTEILRTDGYPIVGEPRMTGDGYYESIVEDPEGNWLKIKE